MTGDTKVRRLSAQYDDVSYFIEMQGMLMPMYSLANENQYGASEAVLLSDMTAEEFANELEHYYDEGSNNDENE